MQWESESEWAVRSARGGDVGAVRVSERLAAEPQAASGERRGAETDAGWKFRKKEGEVLPTKRLA